MCFSWKSFQCNEAQKNVAFHFLGSSMGKFFLTGNDLIKRGIICGQQNAFFFLFYFKLMCLEDSQKSFFPFFLSNVVTFISQAELAECLERDGFKFITEAVGVDCR